MDEGVEQIVIDQMTEVQARHPNLELLRYSSGKLQIRGGVGFSIKHGVHIIEDCFQLALDIPDDYPASPPFVYDTENKIPKDFGHFMEAGNFCLGAPVEVRRRFAQHRNLLCFIEDQIIPYLFTYSYKRDHGTPPFGERSHGTIGLIQYYNEFFETSAIASMKLLKCLADDFAPPMMACPCGGGRKLQDCHGSKLTELRPHLSPKQFEIELLKMIRLLRAKGIQFPKSKVLPKRMWAPHEHRLHKRNKRKR